MTRARNLAVALLLAAVLALPATAAEPVFPDRTWVRLLPDDVESQPDFAQLDSVFVALAESWKTSDLAVKYDEVLPPRTLFDIRASLEGLRQTLAASPSFEDANGPRIRRSLTAELDRLIAATDSVAAGNPLIPADWEHVRAIVSLDRFQRHDATWGGDEVAGATEEDVKSRLVFFGGEPTQIVLMATQGGDLAQFRPFVYFATVAQAVEVRAVMRGVRELFNEQFVKQLAVTAERLRSLNRAWDNYLAKGFTQYPWELLLNSHLTAATWDSPPSWQWVLVHPEVAVVFDTRDAATARAETALTIHGAGAIKYFGDERGWFLGLSASASLTGSADFGLGYGPTLHVGSASTYRKVPHVSISVLWHDFGDDGRKPVVGMNFDLWSLFSQEIGEEKFLEAVAGNL